MQWPASAWLHALLRGRLQGSWLLTTDAHAVLQPAHAPTRAMSTHPRCCSDHELEWQQLESLEQRDAALQAQQVAAREAREAYLCGQLAAAAAAPWAGQPPAASMGVQQEDVYAAEQEARQLAALPSPLNSATIDFDAAVARLLASAGNTPTGPLGQGVRGPGETFAGSAGKRRVGQGTAPGQVLLG